MYVCICVYFSRVSFVIVAADVSAAVNVGTVVFVVVVIVDVLEHATKVYVAVKSYNSLRSCPIPRWHGYPSLPNFV